MEGGNSTEEASAASISGPGVPRCPWEVRPVVRPCPIERGFPTRRYYVQGECPGSGGDLYVRLHYNEVVCVGLAPSHAALRAGAGGLPARRVTRVVFREGIKAPTSKTDRKQGTFLTPDSHLCFVTLDDGTSLPVCAGVKALVLETNVALEQDPDLLTRAPSTEGWLALLQPRGKNTQKHNLEATISEDAYRARVEAAAQPSSATTS